jgi:polyhydroxyalkanoate synthase
MKRQPGVSAELMDISARASWARNWLSVSPASQMMAWLDWIMHLAISPGTRIELARQALMLWEDCLASNLAGICGAGSGAIGTGADKGDASSGDAGNSSVGSAASGAGSPPLDRRFRDEGWNNYPFSVYRQSFLAQQQWWEQATQAVQGVTPHHQRLVSFAAKQWLDMFSPGNFPFTNPTVIAKTIEEGGSNLVRGLGHFLDDVRARLDGEPAAGTENFRVGHEVALTPGKVVLRNRLMELIQYSPTTKQVHPEPVLIVPAWIMKYYILDLSPHNSLIKFLVDQGYTVFCISWKNPDANDRDLGMDDYLSLGWKAGLDAVSAIVPGHKIHATGYCLGGTLLSIAAAAMARDGDERLASVSLFAAQADFSEPGELGLFIDEGQVTLLEAQMSEAGYLRADQMAGAFQMLRSYDLLWSRLVNEYLLGNRRSMNDLMAWNADATRMPAKMHSQYLRRLYLNNDLSAGRYPVGGRPVSLANLKLPIFCVGTVSDHVAPWQSVYKLHLLTPSEITFVLTTGGHNAGIVSPPGHPRRRYQILTRGVESTQLSAEAWQASAPSHEGSWWPAWVEWLQERSSAGQLPPEVGAPDQGYGVVCEYVLSK